MKFCLKLVEHFAGKQIDMWPPKMEKMIKGPVQHKATQQNGRSYSQDFSNYSAL